MRVLVEFTARLIRRVSVAKGPLGTAGRIAAILRELGPYAAIELVLPGGSLLALLLWLHRRRSKTAVKPTGEQPLPC